MLTPLDIQKKTFSKSMSGYQKTEVEQFLKEVSEVVDSLLEERDEFKKQVKAYELDLERFTRIEKNINEALVVAQGTASSVLDNANTKATLMITEADFKSRKMVEDAKMESHRIMRETENLANEFERFKTKLKAMLASEIDAIDRTFPDSQTMRADLGLVQAERANQEMRANQVESLKAVPLDNTMVQEPRVEKSVDPIESVESIVAVDPIETVEVEKARSFEKVNPETEYTQKYDYDRISAIRSKIFEGDSF